MVCFPLRSKKQPAFNGWQKVQNTDLESFDKSHTAYGINCGKPSEATVIDVDFYQYWDRIVKHYNAEKKLSKVAHSISPTGSKHYYFNYEPSVKSRSNAVWIQFGYRRKE